MIVDQAMPVEDEPVNYEKIIEQTIESQPWVGLLESDKSAADKMIKSSKGPFDKYQ